MALTLGALHLPWSVDPAVLDARLLPMERARIVALVRSRITTRRPLPYLLGEAFFAGYPFDVDERVLIPRSPIAELIEHGFAAWFPDEPPARVLDLCTGSGCIGIAAALHLPTCEVDLGDISEEALAVARQNITRHDVGERVRAVHSDLFAAPPGRYDLIVSNPPYVDARDLATMPAEFRHEPALALGAGADGLEIVRRILREAREHLTERGVLIVEVGNSDHHLEAAFPEVPFLWLEFEHVAMTLLVRSLPRVLTVVAAVLSLLAIAVFGALLLWYGWDYFKGTRQVYMVSDQIRVHGKFTAIVVPISGAIILLHLVQGFDLLEHFIDEREMIDELIETADGEKHP